MAYINLAKLDMDKLTRETIRELVREGDTRAADHIHDILDAFVKRLRALEGDHGLADSRNQRAGNGFGGHPELGIR